MFRRKIEDKEIFNLVRDKHRNETLVNKRSAKENGCKTTDYMLKRDQYSLIEDENKNLYRMPSKSTQEIRAIYEALGLKRVSKFISTS